MKSEIMSVVIGAFILNRAVLADISAMTTPCQIEVQAQFISFPKPDIDVLLKAEGGGIPNKDAILDLVKQGKGTVLSAPRVVAPSGIEAVTKVVEEVIYPTKFNVQPPLTNATSLKEPQIVVIVPSDFEMREVGVILQFVATVRETGNIEMITTPQMVARPIWKTYKGKYITPDGKEHEIDFEQPFFQIKSIQTSIQIEDGETVIAGGGMWDQDDISVTFLLISAQTVDSAGKAIHKTPVAKKK